MKMTQVIGLGSTALIASVFLIAMRVCSLAGILGYDSYEECMIEEMRGLPANMIPTVSSFCHEKFPAAEVPTSNLPVFKSRYKSFEECMKSEMAFRGFWNKTLAHMDSKFHCSKENY